MKITNEYLIIIPKPDSVSWEQITQLLHLAYKEKADKNMKYSATHQDPSITKKRVGQGKCLVALYKGELVGTITLNIKRNGENVGFLKQVAVHPNYKGLGIGSMMVDSIFKISQDIELSKIELTTAAKAKSLIKWWQGFGFKLISFTSYSNTNYYSVRMRKFIGNNKYSYIDKLKFFYSILKCKLFFDKNGAIRPFWRKLRKS